MKKTIVAFDFDGTLIKGDSFLQFIKFYKGALIYYSLLPIIGFVWICALIQITTKDIAKELIFKLVFKGESISKFEFKSKAFSKYLDKQIFKGVKSSIKEYKALGYEVIIVSASIDLWIIPYVKTLGINTVIATQIEVENGKLTGNFSTKNCNREEKVNRILKCFSNRTEYYLIAYGNSKGDKDMLALADESYFKYFN